MPITQNLNRLLIRLPGYRALAQRLLRGSSEVSLMEGRFLGELVRRAAPQRPIIEIGTLFGSSTRIMALFKDPATPLLTVDRFGWNPFGLRPAQHRSVTRHRLQQAIDQLGVELIDMEKSAFYASYSAGPPGLVFLDANHSYESTLEDIRWAQRVGADIICGHDYTTKQPGVIQAVEECGGAGELVERLFVLRRRD